MKEVNVEEAINRKYPEWIIQVVTSDQSGRTNAMPAGWCMFTSNQPTMMAVSIGVERYTHKLLKDSEDFVLAFPTEDQKEDVYFCGTNSGKAVDKFEETDLQTSPSSRVQAPLIRDSAACFECRKQDSLVTGDHTIFVGEIVAAHVSERPRKKLYTVAGWADYGADGFRALGPTKSKSEEK